MAAFTVQVDPSMMAALKELPDRLVKTIVRDAMKQGAEITAKAARRLAPVDTGFLEEHIKVIPGKKKKGQIRLQVFGGSDEYKGKAYYASFIEFGYHAGPRTAIQEHARSLSRRKAIRENEKISEALKAARMAIEKRRYIPARPFMRPALDSTRDAAVQKIKNLVSYGIYRFMLSKVGVMAPRRGAV